MCMAWLSRATYGEAKKMCGREDTVCGALPDPRPFDVPQGGLIGLVMGRQLSSER